MQKSHIGAAERLWLASEIVRLVRITKTARRESAWADHVVRNSYLWYWATDGLNERGKIQRNLLRGDPEFLHHTAMAAKAIAENNPVVHDHAVPRGVMIRYLKQKSWETPKDVKDFLDRFCFAVILSKDEEQELKEWRHQMPSPFTDGSDPLERFKKAGVEVIAPKNPRTS